MATKLALGKGIASLIKDTSHEVMSGAMNNYLSEENKNKVAASEMVEKKISNEPYMVSIKDIITNPNQPRKIFKEIELKELADSIKENGIIQPLIVKKSDGVKGFELIAGERRLRAAQIAGLESVPVVVKNVTDREKMIMSIIENVQRSDLNCIEEALAYYQLMDDFKLTQEEVAKKLGKERSTIANFLRILKLPRSVIELIQADHLSFGHAKILAAVKEREDAIRFANTCVEKKLSVRELEKLINSKQKSFSSGNSENSQNNFFNDKLDQYRQKLEQRTGFHFDIKSKKNGHGEIIIKFNNEAEFNDVFEFLANR